MEGTTKEGTFTLKFALFFSNSITTTHEAK